VIDCDWDATEIRECRDAEWRKTDVVWREEGVPTGSAKLDCLFPNFRVILHDESEHEFIITGILPHKKSIESVERHRRRMWVRRATIKAVRNRKVGFDVARDQASRPTFNCDAFRISLKDSKT
jgi:hypothetical protein